MISSTSFPLSFAISSFFLAATVNSAACSTTCDDVHFFLARGNNEPYPGRQEALVTATCDGLSSCGYEDLIYSALYTDLSCQTDYDGTIAGHKQLTAYVEACPNSKLILAGYSQGAQIVTDILGGGGGTSFNGCVQPDTPALDSTTSPGNKLVAAIVFGNTRHTANQAYNFGNGSAIDGLYPRSSSQLSALDAYSSILRDWCVQTDPICAANQDDSEVAAHLGYYNTYPAAAASWIKSVASLTDDSTFTTAIPTSVSGTVQDYATVGTATPSGTVTLDTTWTEYTSVVSCTGAVGSSSSPSSVTSTTSSVGVSSTSSSTSSVSGSSTSVSASASTSPSKTQSSGVTTTSANVASQTTSAKASSTSSAAGFRSVNTGAFFIPNILVMLFMM